MKEMKRKDINEHINGGTEGRQKEGRRKECI
jgi:hypothetical protein